MEVGKKKRGWSLASIEKKVHSRLCHIACMSCFVMFGHFPVFLWFCFIVVVIFLWVFSSDMTGCAGYSIERVVS